MNYENLVMNKGDIFLPLTFGLEFMTDEEVREELKEHYLLEECVYWDSNLMTYVLQHKADEVKDYFNRLYRTTLYKYDPLENYKIVESEEGSNSSTASSSTNSQTDSFEYPMDTQNQKQTGKGLSTGSGSSSGKSEDKRNLIRSGNVNRTAQEMIKEEREILLNIKELYLKQFSDYFMITI